MIEEVECDSGSEIVVWLTTESWREHGKLAIGRASTHKYGGHEYECGCEGERSENRG